MKIYEIKRHKIVDMWIAYNLGMMAESRKNIDQLIDTINEEIKSYKENTETFTTKEKVKIEKIIAQRKKRIVELEIIKQQNVNIVYDRVREKIDSKNIIAVDVTKEYIEIIEFDMESNRDIFIMGKEDNNGRVFIEVK